MNESIAGHAYSVLRCTEIAGIHQGLAYKAATLDRGDGFAEHELIAQHYVGSAYGHAFRAAELAYDMGVAHGRKMDRLLKLVPP